MSEGAARGALLALLAVTALLFGRAVGFEFVDYDDPTYVTENPVVQRGLTAEGLAWALRTGHGSNWHPLTWLSHMLDVELFGPDPAGHHATSVALHVLNVLLVYLVFRRASSRRAESLVVAALFALHPLRVESVAWVSERKDVLSAALGLASALTWVWRGTGRPRRRARLASLGLFALGLTAKPMLVTLPFVLVALDWSLLGRRSEGLARLLAEKAPMLALSALAGLATLLAQGAGGSVAELGSLPLGARLSQAAIAPWLYLGKLLWPSGLSVLYPHPYQSGGTPWPNGVVAAGAAALVVSVALALARARSWPGFAAGWLATLTMLLPVLGIVQVGSQGLADRYTYLPLLGIVGAAVFGVGRVVRRSDRRVRAAVLAAAAGLLVASATLAWRQLGAWRDSRTLFERSLAATPRNPVLRLNLGGVFLDEGDLERAIECYREALEDLSSRAGAHHDLGVALGRAGRPAAAEQSFRRAIELDPEHAGAWSGLGLSLAARGRTDVALAPLRRALELDPAERQAAEALEFLTRAGASDE